MSASRLGVVVGCGRSGTHWLGQILDSHPDVTVAFEPPETFELVTEMALDPGQSARCMPLLLDLYERRLEQCTTRWFIDKAHPLLWFTDAIAQRFPDVVFVGIERDPYETVSSMLRHENVSAWARQWRQYPVPNDFLGITVADADHYDDYPMARRHAMRWRAHADRMSLLRGSRGFEAVRYESLTGEPGVVTGRLARALGVQDEFADVVVDRRGSPQWWEVLSVEDAEAVAEVAGRMPLRRPPLRSRLTRWLHPRKRSSY